MSSPASPSTPHEPRSFQIHQPSKHTFARVTQLFISTYRGIVNIVGTDGPPTLEVSSIAGRPLNVEYRDGRLAIDHGKWPGFWRQFSSKHKAGPIDLTIAIPRECIVDANLVTSGGIVSGLTAGAKLRSVGGALTIANMAGAIDAHTVSGSIEAQQLTGEIQAETVSGSIALIEAEAEVYAKTVSGAVTVAVGERPDGTVRVSTVSGDVTIEAPARPDVSVSFHSTTGHLVTAFDELNRADMPGMHFANGVLGKGTGKLWASSTSGSISLLRRSSGTRFDVDNPTDDQPSSAATNAGEVR